MLFVVWALVVGVFSHFVKKLGPSIVLFVFAWAMHSKLIARLGSEIFGVPVDLALVAAMLILGIMSIAFKDQVMAYSHRMNARAMPWIDQQVLTRLNHCDLYILALRNRTVTVLDTMTATALYVVLALIAISASRLVSLIILVVLVATLLRSCFVKDMKTHVPQPPANVASRLWNQPDYFAEFLMTSGLTIGFLDVGGSKGLIGGTAVILLASRFTGELKSLGRNIVKLRRQQNWIHWQQERRLQQMGHSHALPAAEPAE